MEWFTGTNDLLCAASALSMIVASVVCALIRWFHVCAPYRQNPSYYYPARPAVTLMFLCQLLYLPFVIRPSDPSVTAYIRPLPLLLVTTFVPLILDRFFRQSAFRLSSPLFLPGLACVGLAVVAGMSVFSGCFRIRWIEQGWLLTAGCVGLFQSIVTVRTIAWLIRKIERHQMDEYSNDSDFPFRFAKSLQVFPALMVILCWVILLTGSRLFLCIFCILFMIAGVAYTIRILDSQRENVGSDTVGEEESVSAPDDGKPVDYEVASGIDEEVRLRVINMIKDNYLNPSITRRTIISMLDYGQRTAAGAVISHYGFYEMVNTFRLEHARLYAIAHPNETKESVAERSGFRDRFAMRHASRKIGSGIVELLDGFTPQES